MKMLTLSCTCPCYIHSDIDKSMQFATSGAKLAEKYRKDEKKEGTKVSCVTLILS